MRSVLKQAGVALLFILGMHCFFIQNAHAYLDPGTGSMILQGILGALAAGAVFAKIYWQRLMHLFGFKKKDSEQLTGYTENSRSDNADDDR